MADEIPADLHDCMVKADELSAYAVVFDANAKPSDLTGDLPIYDPANDNVEIPRQTGGDRRPVGSSSSCSPRPTPWSNRVATGPERAVAIVLRKTALMSGDVRKQLGCTLTKLDRWHADGRLPHLFTRKMRFEKATTSRFWSAGRVADATVAVPAWREQDKIRKAYARSGLRTTTSR